MGEEKEGEKARLPFCLFGSSSLKVRGRSRARRSWC